MRVLEPEPLEDRSGKLLITAMMGRQNQGM